MCWKVRRSLAKRDLRTRGRTHCSNLAELFEHNFRNVTLYLMRRNYFRPIHPAFVKDVYGLEHIRFDKFFSVSAAYSGKSKELLAHSCIFNSLYITSFQEKLYRHSRVQLISLYYWLFRRTRKIMILLLSNSYVQGK